jgi:hypothetical protein
MLSGFTFSEEMKDCSGAAITPAKYKNDWDVALRD